MYAVSVILVEIGAVKVDGAGMDICLLWVMCVAMQRSLRRADHSSRGALLSVVCLSVWSRNLKHEEAMAHVGPQRHRKKVDDNQKLSFWGSRYF
jgi:hypothetical protein